MPDVLFVLYSDLMSTEKSLFMQAFLRLIMNGIYLNHDSVLCHVALKTWHNWAKNAAQPRKPKERRTLESHPHRFITKPRLHIISSMAELPCSQLQYSAAGGTHNYSLHHVALFGFCLLVSSPELKRQGFATPAMSFYELMILQWAARSGSLLLRCAS